MIRLPTDKSDILGNMLRLLLLPFDVAVAALNAIQPRYSSLNFEVCHCLLFAVRINSWSFLLSLCTFKGISCVSVCVFLWRFGCVFD